MKLRHYTVHDLSYDTIRYVILIGFTILCVLPFIHVLGVSLMPQREAIRSTAILWPSRIELTAYQSIFNARRVSQGIANSSIITIGGTLISLLITSTFAYGLSKRHMPGHKMLNILVVFSMMFSGGLIPLYLLVKTIGLLDSYLAVIFPLCVNPFWAILMRNFFENLPEELFECAEMEGANEWTIYYKITVPLSKAAIAAFTLFYSVRFWNEFFYAIMFISKSDMWPIQVWLREMIVNDASAAVSEVDSDVMDSVRAPRTMQMAIVIVATLPILFVYPFLQKHFAKGIMLGSVKG